MNQKLPTEQTRDGFHLKKIEFELPFDISSLDPKTQLDLLICHLFVNDKRSISAITLIGVDPPSIVQALLEQGAISERRRGSRRPEANSSNVDPFSLGHPLKTEPSGH